MRYRPSKAYRYYRHGGSPRFTSVVTKTGPESDAGPVTLHALKLSEPYLLHCVVSMIWPMMLEAGSVIRKRLLKISKGGKGAVRESQRMVSEKIIAATEAGLILSSGGSMKRVMSNYRKKIRANNRRLK